MDRARVRRQGAQWYRRLQVQIWLWAIMPLTLALVAISFAGVYNHQRTMRDFVAERDVAMAQIYGRQIQDAVSRGSVSPDGAGLPAIMGDARIGQHGVIYVLDAQQRILFHPDAALIGKSFPTNPTALYVTHAGTGMVSGRITSNEQALVSYAPVGDTGWRVLVEEPVSDVITPILQFSSGLPVAMAIAGLFSLIVIYFSLRTIARPLQHLAEEAAQITGGDFEGLQQEVGGVEEIRQLQNALRDMVERIRRYQESMRDYIDGITQGQEAERARLSRELHDGTIQDLVAVSQRLQLAQRALNRGDMEAAQAGIDKLRTLSEDTLAELRRTIRALRPAYLQDLGFIPALEALVREAGETGLATEVFVQGTPRRLCAEVELAAFRVVQEALNNAIRHAQAQHVSLAICFRGERLTLVIEDDGIGFQVPSEPDALTQSGHLGLVGMRERATLLEGTLEVWSAPNQGTRITARFPLQPVGENHLRRQTPLSL